MLQAHPQWDQFQLIIPNLTGRRIVIAYPPYPCSGPGACMSASSVQITAGDYPDRIALA